MASRCALPRLAARLMGRSILFLPVSPVTGPASLEREMPVLLAELIEATGMWDEEDVSEEGAPSAPVEVRRRATMVERRR